MVSDFLSIFYWWLLLFILGLIFLPLTSWFFHRFFDKGYALSKITAILAVSYLVWLVGNFKILPFTAQTICLVVIVLATANFLFFKKKTVSFWQKIKENWKVFVSEELLFFLALSFWSLIRGFQPGIQGLEKFMDYGFVNTILRSKYFPPSDMWLAGETINYYYFGHLASAVLTKLSGLDSAITYNLMIATVFALTFTAGFSLGGNLFYLSSKSQAPIPKESHKMSNSKQIQKNKFKILKSFKFWPFNHWKLFRNWKIGHWKLPIVAGLLSASLLTLGGNLHPLYWFLKNGNYRSYWYPDATRFIVEKFGAADNTIHEFPIYSFVVADLHGHMIDIPNVLLILSLILILGLEISGKKDLKQLIFLLSFLSLCLAVAFMTNAWDYPIYLLIAGGVIFFSHKFKSNLVDSLINLASCGGILLAGSLVFSLPFLIHFKNITQGIALTDFHSPAFMLLVLWGFPFLTTIAFGVFLIKSWRQKENLNLVDYFILIVLLVYWFLILVPEFIYVKDIYIHSYQRANTMFKLTYQSFMMFSLAGGYIIIRILANLRSKISKFIFIILYSLFLIPVFIYPRYAIKSYYGLKNYQGLYGLSYLKNNYPNDYEAILWLRKNVVDQPVITEAVGESYTDFARVSANTGLPTILGWRVHEWLWRGSFDEAGKRTEEVNQIYQSPNLDFTKTLLDKYQAKYIFLGDLERQQYPQLQERKIAQLGQVVFSSGATKIYQIKD